MRTIVWFRDEDLRLSDHAPLRDASARGEVIPLFVLDPCAFAPARAQEAPHRTQLMLDALRALEEGFAERGSQLLVVAGDSTEVVPRLVRAWRADRVVAQSSVEPGARRRDGRIGEVLGARLELRHGGTLLPPGTLRTGGGKQYSVFGQFARAFHRSAILERPLAPPGALPPPPADVKVRATAIPACEALGVRRNPALLPAGERPARERLRRFVRAALAAYPERRDRLDLAGTSRLSADLRLGTISVRQVWAAVQEAAGGTRAARSFQDELLWREFAHHMLWARPELLARPFKPAFLGFPWRDDEARWQAWVAGRTGYPVVDAAARQLLAEGFVHNRARMISASFLAKDLLIDFRRGEAHYMRYLADADPASNDAGWQWSAGTGCDAQPWFRIFNPVVQGERFDPDGDYVRRWVPELGRLPARWIHRPWEAPPAVLSGAGVRLGRDYPAPIVDHRLAREHFLTMASRHLRTRGSVRQPAGHR